MKHIALLCFVSGSIVLSAGCASVAGLDDYDFDQSDSGLQGDSQVRDDASLRDGADADAANVRDADADADAGIDADVLRDAADGDAPTDIARALEDGEVGDVARETPDDGVAPDGTASPDAPTADGTTSPDALADVVTPDTTVPADVMDSMVPDTTEPVPDVVVNPRVCTTSDRKCSVITGGAIASECNADGQWVDTRCPYNACDTVNRTCRVYTSVSSDSYTACGLRSDGSMYCWKDYADRVSGVPTGTFASISVNSWGACGLRPDRSVTCWSGLTGGGSDRPDWLAATPSDKLNTAISLGDYFTTCALRGTAIKCWGSTLYEEALPTFSDAYTALSKGSMSRAFCGITTTGKLDCRGYFGGYGDQSAASTYTPTGTYSAVALAIYNGCALRSADGTIACFGFGYKANGSVREQPTPPSGSFVEIAAASNSFCARRSNGTVACWGYPTNTPNLEMPSTTDRFTSISGECGVLTNGKVTCWTSNLGSPTQ